MSGVIVSSLSRWPWRRPYKVLDLSHTTGSDYQLVTPNFTAYFDDVDTCQYPGLEPTGWRLLDDRGHNVVVLDFGQVPTGIEDVFTLIKNDDQETLDRLRGNTTPSGGARG